MQQWPKYSKSWHALLLLKAIFLVDSCLEKDSQGLFLGVDDNTGFFPAIFGL